MRAPKRILILGATSAMAQEAARLWAAQGARIGLLARDEGRLAVIADDLATRGASEIVTVSCDCAKAESVAALDDIAARFGGLDIVLLAYGVLGDQTMLERNPTALVDLLQVNFVSAALWCQAASNLLEKQTFGSLVVIGSVAGDRGRQSNYVYGAAKAGLGVLVQGIAHRLARSGARAVLIKPGFVDTPMTAGFSKGPLWASAEQLGKIIAGAAENGRTIVYAPGFWRLIMLVIRSVPARIFHKTRL
ncbi:Acetoacetyl-CoA reductase [Granulibacter bethesdensis]|uniref:Acetoacetyl-CoA reductase n=1 Tax=Granulibacter bethesdensis TaxID=364410 RepID=A0AAC9K8D5_9PROT|nr:SDR family NAD(P)-dependent oxidoreductase [Granulibacter bethesdensis]APH55606.1 Acetoacetyl-CoA reductase [Granulibacter bethesdensis]APH63191.1 Acetoacetyl-CoA reductase [Granulibacter bethesdensis]